VSEQTSSKESSLGLISDSKSGLQLQSICNQLNLLEISYQNLNEELSSSSSDEVVIEEAARFLQEKEDRFILALSISGNSFQIKMNQRQEGPSAVSVKNLDHLINAIKEDQGIRLFDYYSANDLKYLLEMALFLTSKKMAGELND
jgi:hypothetical protein